LALSAIYVDPGKLRLVAATAGLPPFAFIRSGAVEFVSTANPVLGAISGSQYTEVERDFLGGDRVLVYTDGLVECPARFFNMEQANVAELMRLNADKGVDDIAATFAANLPDEACADDVTVVSLRMPGKEA
jgi:serine phosphatase RsbU (regulator of sigma subunit)